MCFGKRGIVRVFVVVFWLFLLTVCFFADVHSGLAVPENGQVNVPFSNVALVVDGRWSDSAEWSGAVEVELRNELGEEAYVMLKHNDTHVFVVVDFAADYTRSTFDVAGICLDTQNDGGDLPMEDDYLFALLAGQAPSWVYCFRGMGRGSKPEDAWSLIFFSGAVGCAGFSTSQHEGTRDHRIYELQISFQNWKATMSYGFYVFAFDYHSMTFLEWPYGAGGRWTQTAGSAPQYIPPSPNSWGVLEDNWVPEFSFPVLFLSVGLAVAFVSLLVGRCGFRKK